MEKVICGYEIQESLGEGGMACVYKAFDPSTNRTIALKLLKKEYSNNEFYRNRFLGEAKAAGHLSHPNIVTIYSVSKESDDDLFIAMEYLRGITLEDLMRSDDRMPFEAVIEIGMQLAEALDYAHAHGVIHRDIKPSNIIFFDENNERIKITDFGIAHVDMMGQPGLTQTGMIMGTPEYMSPEQAKGEKIGKESDLFSAGVVLYRLLSKHQPFYGDTWGKRYQQIVETAPKPVQSYYADIPAILWVIIKKLLEKSPDKRYQSGRELIEALETAKQGLAAEKKRDGNAWQFGRIVVASQILRVKLVEMKQKIFDVSNAIKLTLQKYTLLVQYLIHNSMRKLKLIPAPFFLASFCILLILAFVNGTFFYINNHQERNAKEVLENTGALVATVIAEGIGEDVALNDWVAAETIVESYRQGASSTALIEAIFVTDANNTVRVPNRLDRLELPHEFITSEKAIIINENILGYVHLQMSPQQYTPISSTLLAALNIFTLAVLIGLCTTTHQYLRKHILDVSNKIDQLIIGRRVDPIAFNVGGAFGKLVVSFNHLLLDVQRMNHTEEKKKKGRSNKNNMTTVVADPPHSSSKSANKSGSENVPSKARGN